VPVVASVSRLPATTAGNAESDPENPGRLGVLFVGPHPPVQLADLGLQSTDPFFDVLRLHDGRIPPANPAPR